MVLLIAGFYHYIIFLLSGPIFIAESILAPNARI